MSLTPDNIKCYPYDNVISVASNLADAITKHDGKEPLTIGILYITEPWITQVLGLLTNTLINHTMDKGNYSEDSLGLIYLCNRYNVQLFLGCTDKMADLYSLKESFMVGGLQILVEPTHPEYQIPINAPVSESLVHAHIERVLRNSVPGKTYITSINDHPKFKPLYERLIGKVLSAQTKPSNLNKDLH